MHEPEGIQTTDVVIFASSEMHKKKTGFLLCTSMMRLPQGGGWDTPLDRIHVMVAYIISRITKSSVCKKIFVKSAAIWSEL